MTSDEESDLNLAERARSRIKGERQTATLASKRWGHVSIMSYTQDEMRPYLIPLLFL